MSKEFGKGGEWQGLNLPPGVNFEDLGIPRPSETPPALEEGGSDDDGEEPGVTPVVYEAPVNKLPPHVMEVPDFLKDRPSDAERPTSGSDVEHYVEEGEFVDPEAARVELPQVISPRSEGNLREVVQTFAMMARRAGGFHPSDRDVCLADEVDFATVAEIIRRGEQQAIRPTGPVVEHQHPQVTNDRPYGILVRREPPPERNYEGMNRLKAWKQRRDDKGWDAVAPMAFFPGRRQMEVLGRSTLITEGDQLSADNAVLGEELRQHARLVREGIIAPGSDASETLGIGAALTGAVEISDETIFGWPDSARENILQTLANELVAAYGQVTPEDQLEFLRKQALYDRIAGIHWSADKPDTALDIKASREGISQKWRLPKAENTVLVVTGGIAESPGVLPVLISGLAPRYTDIVVGGNQYHSDTERALREMHPGIRCAGASIEYALMADLVVVQGGPMLAADKLLQHIRPGGGMAIIPGGPEYDHYRAELVEIINDPFRVTPNEFTILDSETSGVLETEGLASHDGTAYVHVDGRETMFIMRNAPMTPKKS